MRLSGVLRSPQHPTRVRVGFAPVSYVTRTRHTRASHTCLPKRERNRTLCVAGGGSWWAPHGGAGCATHPIGDERPKRE